MKFLLHIVSFAVGLSTLIPAHAATLRGGSSGKAVEAELKRRQQLVPKASTETLKKVDSEALRKAAIKAGPLKPSIDQSKRTNFPDPKTKPTPKREGAYPWHFDITATYFYIGELPTRNNPTPTRPAAGTAHGMTITGALMTPIRKTATPSPIAPKGLRPGLIHSM